MPQFPDPLNSWFGWVWMAALCLSGLFLSLDGCEPKHPSAHAAEFSANEWTKGVVIIKPAVYRTADNPSHLCHIEEPEWDTAGTVLGTRMYGRDHIMVLRTYHGCTCVFFLPDWTDVDGEAYPDGSVVTVRGITVGGQDSLSRLYALGVNEAVR